MKFYLGVTDNKWFRYLWHRNPEDVNFWQPGSNTTFKVSLRLTTPLYKFGIKYLSQRFPDMRQQFIYFIDGVSIDSLQNIPEPDERVYAVEFAGTH